MMNPTGAMSRYVPEDVRRQLWAESIGRCMNPSCQTNLMPDGRSIADMAHIDAHASGGPNSFENLILLCGNCHKQVDATPPLAIHGELRAWKAQRKSQIEQQFAEKFSTFDELQESITPILQRNEQVFRSYGPDSDSPDARVLWLQFEGEIIANNRRMELMLVNNKSLLHKENQEIVDEFLAHTREFIVTRQDYAGIRINLFPDELLSIFGLKEIETSLIPKVSALQNFIGHLLDKGQFRGLELVRKQVVEYEEDGQIITMNLKNRPMVQQIFRNGKFFWPSATELRLRDLVFFVEWLSANKIEWKFDGICNLTELTVGGYQVKILYKYQASLADIQTIPAKQGLLIVNLHDWNRGPFTPDAIKYANDVGMRVFNQKKFFSFAHRNMK